MSEETTQSAEACECAETSDAARGLPDVERRWPAVAAFATAWLLPATTAQRTAHVSLRRAYGVHLVTFALTLLLMLWLAAWEDTGRHPDRTVAAQFGRGLEQLARLFVRHPEEYGLAGVGVFVGVEASVLFLAVIIMPWGARDERVRASFANSLRRTWLQMTHALPLTLIVGVALVAFFRAEQRLRYRTSPPPSRPAGIVQGSQAWKDYQEAMTKWQQEMQTAWRDYYEHRPWFLKHGEELIAYLCFAAATWFLWAWFRAAGAARAAPPMERPPLCETCGYNLTAARMDGRCPECGHGVAESLGPNARPGTLWQRRHEAGFWRAWWRCCVDPIVRPAWFGRQILATSTDTQHRRFLLMHLPAVFIIGAVGIVFCYVVDTGRNPFVHESMILWGVGPLVGYLTAAFVVIFVLLAAGLIGASRRVGDGRNLMCPAMQLAAYLSGYLVLWTLFAAVSGVLAFAAKHEPLTREIARLLHTNHDAVVFVGWLIPNFLCAGGYLLLAARGAIGFRYANR